MSQTYEPSSRLLWISSFPLAALALFSIDLLVIYGLASWAYRDDS